MAAFIKRAPVETAQKLDQSDPREGWRFAEIAQGLAEAKQGDFATDAEVDAVFAKFGVNGRAN